MTGFITLLSFVGIVGVFTCIILAIFERSDQSARFVIRDGRVRLNHPRRIHVTHDAPLGHRMTVTIHPRDKDGRFR